jgi:hypothetical protein
MNTLYTKCYTYSPRDCHITGPAHIMVESHIFSEKSVCFLLFVYFRNLPGTIYQPGYSRFLVYTWKKLLTNQQSAKIVPNSDVMFDLSLHTLTCDKNFSMICILKKILIPSLFWYMKLPLNFVTPVREYCTLAYCFLLSCSLCTLVTSSSSHVC